MKYTVQVLRSAAEIEGVRCVWEQWQSHPNSDFDHYLAVCEIRRNVKSPHVIVAYERNEPRAILASRLEDGCIAPMIGYFSPVKLPVRSLVVLNHGLLGTIDEEIAELLLGALRDELKGKVDVVELFYQPEDSPLVRLALSRTSRMWRDTVPALSSHWGLNLPSEVGGLLDKMTSKHRSWIRRKTRDLEAAFPGQLRYRAYAAGDDVYSLAAELESVANLTYQRGLGSGFINDEEHRERFAIFARANRLRVWMLYLGNHPRAFTVGFIYGNTFHFSETGYDPCLRSNEVGTLLFLHMIDDLIREGVENFDFGFGDAHYKQRFGDHEWKEASLRLYAHTARGFAARNCTGFFDAITGIGRTLVHRMGLLDKLRTAWRRKIATQGNNGTPL